RQAFAALVATGEPVAAFLRDAENPAHTRWNGNAEKLGENWRAAPGKLTQIRNSLRALYDVLAQATERTEVDALVSILSVKASGPSSATPRRQPVVTPPQIPVLKPSPKIFGVSKLRNGFSVRAGKDLQPAQLPVRIKVRVGYDLTRGDPFKRHSPFD